VEHPSNTAVTPEVSRPGITARQTRRVLASVCSCILPGSGQLWLGKTLVGIGFLCAFGLLALLYVAFRLPRSYVGIQVLIFAAMGLCTAAAWHALRTASQRMIQGSRWWLFVLVPISLLASFAYSNWFLLAAEFRSFDVPSTGMEQTVLSGDHVIADLRQYRNSRPKRRDVVLFSKDGTFFIKRVVAVGGDTIEGKDGTIFVNGQRLNEPYVQHLGNLSLVPNEFSPVEIASGELFVMGDNRDVSRDSRMGDFGLVPEKTVAGKALYIIRSKWGRIGNDLR
jgi:signal peptidase I